MRTRSLVSRPKTTVNGLKARLVHKMAGRQYQAVQPFPPAALDKAYEHQVGKALGWSAVSMIVFCAAAGQSS